MIADSSEQLRVYYEGIVKQNPSNLEAVHYLAGNFNILFFLSLFFFVLYYSLF